MTPKEIKKILKFKGDDKEIKNKVDYIIDILPKRGSIDMGAMTSVRVFIKYGFGSFTHPDTRLDSNREKEKLCLLANLQGIITEVNTWWENNKDNFHFDKDTNQAKSKRISKVLNALTIFTLIVSVLALGFGLWASIHVDDKDTLFFALEGGKDIWNSICDVITLLCPSSGIASVVSLAIKQKGDIKNKRTTRWTLLSFSSIGIVITCILIAFRALGRYTWVATIVLFAIFIGTMIFCVGSLRKYDGEIHEEKQKN